MKLPTNEIVKRSEYGALIAALGSGDAGNICTIVIENC